jgi:Domain of unknown function (DUF4170)
MAKQLLHLVFGGELKDPGGVEFADLERLDIIGIYPDYQTAYRAWRGAAQRTVDNAHMRYFIVHLHRLLDPDSDGGGRDVPGGPARQAPQRPVLVGPSVWVALTLFRHAPT